MKAYTQKIPGRKADKNRPYDEDSCFHTTFIDEQDNPTGIYLIGDGLSGYEGDRASNRVVNELGKSLEEKLKSNRQQLKDQEICSFTSAKIRELNQQLLGTYRTTLDSIVIRDGKAYIHHLGDGRVYFLYADGRIKQVTVDEVKEGGPDAGPSNAVGALQRINEHVEQLNNVRYIFMTTDGLMSRVTEQQIDTLLRTVDEYNGAALLDCFARLIDEPREKLAELSTESLYPILQGKMPVIPHDKKELVGKIFELYRTDAEVRERVNIKLKYDDATMILIDLKNRLSQLAGDQIDRSQRIGQERDQFLREAAEAEGKYDREKEEKERLQARLDELRQQQSGLEEKLRELEAVERRATTAERNFQTEKEAADELRKGYQALKVERDSLAGKITELEELKRTSGEYDLKKGEWEAEKGRWRQQIEDAGAEKKSLLDIIYSTAITHAASVLRLALKVSSLRYSLRQEREKSEKEREAHVAREKEYTGRIAELTPLEQQNRALQKERDSWKAQYEQLKGQMDEITIYQRVQQALAASNSQLREHDHHLGIEPKSADGKGKELQ